MMRLPLLLAGSFAAHLQHGELEPVLIGLCVILRAHIVHARCAQPTVAIWNDFKERKTPIKILTEATCHTSIVFHGFKGTAHQEQKDKELVTVTQRNTRWGPCPKYREAPTRNLNYHFKFYTGCNITSLAHERLAQRIEVVNGTVSNEMLQATHCIYL